MRPVRPVKPPTRHFEDCLITLLREGLVVSWMGSLEVAQAKIAAARNGDPWRLPLERIRGQIDFDGLERVSSQTLLDILEVPQRSRRAPVFRRVAKLMAELGWTAVRVRDLTRGGYKEQVRGYCRDARCRSIVPNPDHPTVGSSAPV
jgi:hypothetical protein